MMKPIERRAHIKLAGRWHGSLTKLVPATLVGTGNLAVHRGISIIPRRWSISHVSTGYAVSCYTKGLRTRAEALAMAHKLDARGGKLWDFTRLSQFRRRRRKLIAIRDEVLGDQSCKS